MPQYRTHVMVCVTQEGAEDKRHCGDKGGPEVLKAFRLAIAQHKLTDSVYVSKAGCTSQHRGNTPEQATVIIYGPKAELGMVWYRARVEDVEEIVREHVIGGRPVERLVNPELRVKAVP